MQQREEVQEVPRGKRKIEGIDMAHRTPRGLLAGALLLATATTARAQCAWVLWSLNTNTYQMMLRQTPVNGRPVPNSIIRTNWERLGAFETQAQCVAAMETRTKRQREFRSSGEEAKLLQKLDKDLGQTPGSSRPTVWENTCWPAGVNPWPDSWERD